MSGVEREAGAGHICVECGEHEHGNWLQGTAEKLARKQLCFTCEFWLEKVDRRDHANVARIKGKHYVIGDPNEKGPFRGLGGTPHRIQFNDGRVVDTSNLWVQGGIPERFKDRLPDNATFLPLSAAIARATGVSA